jgi:hypothetical protein
MLSLLLKVLCCLGRRKNAVSKQKGWCISKIGWCVGCNPPSVVCGIRLIGLPAPSGRCFIGDCLPFPLAGRPFHRFHSSALDITNVSLPVWVDVSFLLRCQRSRVVPGDCNSTCGRSFLRPKFLDPTATHQLASPPKMSIRKQ